MKLLILSPFALIGAYVWVCMYVEKRRLRALSLQHKCRHGTSRTVRCMLCVEEQADSDMINDVRSRHDYLKRERMDE